MKTFKSLIGEDWSPGMTKFEHFADRGYFFFIDFSFSDESEYSVRLIDKLEDKLLSSWDDFLSFLGVFDSLGLTPA